MMILFGRRLAEAYVKGLIVRLNERDIECRYAYRASKRGIMDAIRDGVDGVDVDVIVVTEVEMRSGNYTAEEFVYMKYRRDIKIIPIVSIGRKGTAYMAMLLENGIYTALYPEDAGTVGTIEQIILHGRTYKDAALYYGV